MNLEIHLPKAANLLENYCTSSNLDLLLFLSNDHRNFPTLAPKAHINRFNFILYFQIKLKASHSHRCYNDLAYHKYRPRLSFQALAEKSWH